MIEGKYVCQHAGCSNELPLWAISGDDWKDLSITVLPVVVCDRDHDPVEMKLTYAKSPAGEPVQAKPKVKAK